MKIKKILIISPEALTIESVPQGAAPLLAGFLEKNKFSVKLIPFIYTKTLKDNITLDQFIEKRNKYIQKNIDAAKDADLIILTTWPTDAKIASVIGEKIRKENKEIPILRGGYLYRELGKDPSTAKELLDQHTFVNIGSYVQQGSHTLLRIIKALEGNDRLENIPGIFYYDQKNNFHYNPLPAAESKEYQLILHTFGDLLGLHHYHDAGMILKTVIIDTATGCPYSCSFCTDRFSKYLRRSIDDCKNQFRMIKYVSPNSEVLSFLDPDFTALIQNPEKRKEFYKILHELEKSGLVANAFARYNEVDEESIKEMAKNGIKSLLFGAETITEDVLWNQIKKGHITKEHMEEINDLCIKYGIKPRISFIVDFKGETLKSIDMNIKFAVEQGKKGCMIAFHKPAPNIRNWYEISKIAEQFGGSKASVDLLDISHPSEIDSEVTLYEQVAMGLIKDELYPTRIPTLAFEMHAGTDIVKNCLADIKDIDGFEKSLRKKDLLPFDTNIYNLAGEYERANRELRKYHLLSDGRASTGDRKIAQKSLL